MRKHHLTLGEKQVATELGRSTVTVDEGESPRLPSRRSADVAFARQTATKIADLRL
jgi:hypothetical protein